MKWLDSLPGQEQILWWVGALSLAMLLAMAVALPLVIVRLPEDHFQKNRAPWRTRRRGNRLARCAYLAGKNLLGAVFLLGGIAMLVLPGQGVLAIMVGLSLLSLPGKRRLIRWILRQARAAALVNGIRRKAGKPPLRIPD